MKSRSRGKAADLPAAWVELEAVWDRTVGAPGVWAILKATR